MQKRYLLLITFFLFVSLIGDAQNYDEAIKRMFAGKEDVDFILKSISSGSEETCEYYIDKDSLYEDNMRTIALRDIDFTANDVYQNVFNTINGAYPFVLGIHAKAGKHVYFYNYPVNGTIDLYLPDAAFTEQTYDYLSKAARGEFGNTNAAQQNTTTPGPQEICNSTVSFLKDLVSTNLSGYIGNVLSKSDMGFTTYASNILFPLAISTSIIDTNMFQQYYRSAEILMMEENQYSQDISDAMQHNYEQLCGILKMCLEASGFTYENGDNNPYSIYKRQTEYTKFLPNDSNDLFAALQEDRGLVVNVRVDQSNMGNGVYRNQLYIYLKEQ